MELLRSYLRRHFAGKPPVESRNVGCFFRLQPNRLFLQPPPQVLRFSHKGGELETRVTREWLTTKRRGSRKGEKREAKPVFSFPPSFARIERETSGYGAAISRPVSKTLALEMRLSAKSFMWKSILFEWEKPTNFTSKTLHLPFAPSYKRL